LTVYEVWEIFDAVEKRDRVRHPEKLTEDDLVDDDKAYKKAINQLFRGK